MPTLAELTTATEPRFLNINEASKACGLSPSVLRIWELRYGWPNPRRRSNGYRAYSPHLVDDLKRMAELVKSGHAIRQLIEDGVPQWPLDEESQRPRTIDYARSLPKPRQPEAAELQEHLLDAIERHQTGQVRELLQRAVWIARPGDESCTELVPLLVAMAELHTVDRPLDPDTEHSIQNAVAKRAMQLLRRHRNDGNVIRGMPVDSDDTALACVTALLLNERGVPAQPWLEEGRPARDERIVRADADGGARQKGRRKLQARVTLLETDAHTPIAALLDRDRELSWMT